jgi:hypothetical protein
MTTEVRLDRQKYLATLSKMIYDKSYVDNAIQRIALILSRQIVTNSINPQTW